MLSTLPLVSSIRPLISSRNAPFEFVKMMPRASRARVVAMQDRCRPLSWHQGTHTLDFALLTSPKHIKTDVSYVAGRTSPDSPIVAQW